MPHEDAPQLGPELDTSSRAPLNAADVIETLERFVAGTEPPFVYPLIYALAVEIDRLKGAVRTLDAMRLES